MNAQQMKEHHVMSAKKSPDYWLEGFKTQLASTGLTQKDISNIKDDDDNKIVSQVHINRIMTGKVGAGNKLRERLSEIFNLSSRDLINIGYTALTRRTATKGGKHPKTESSDQTFFPPTSTTEVLLLVRHYLEKGEKELAVAVGQYNTLEALFEATPVGLTAINRKGIVIKQNYASIAAFGSHENQPHDDLQRQWNPKWTYEGSYIERCFNTRKVVEAPGETYGQEYRFISAPVLGASGHVEGVLTITSHYPAPETDQAKLNITQAFMDTMASGYALLTKQKEVLRWNTRLADILDINKEQISFHDIMDHLSTMKNGGDLIAMTYSAYETQKQASKECICTGTTGNLLQKLTPLFSEDNLFTGMIFELSAIPEKK